MDVRSLPGTAAAVLDEQSDRSERDVAQGNLRRVLLVDGDCDRRANISRCLRHDGLEVSVTRTGREAIDRALLARPAMLNTYCRDEAFDLILISSHVSDMAGPDVIRELRAQGQTAPIVILANGGTERRAEESYDGEEVIWLEAGGQPLSESIALYLNKGFRRRPR